MFFITQQTVDSFWIQKRYIRYKYILYNTVRPLWCKLYNYENTQSDLPSAEAGKYRSRILGRNPAKSRFPPRYSQSPLQVCLRCLFLQITQPLTVSIKEKGGKTDRKPFPPFPLVEEIHTNTSCLGTFKIMLRNINMIVRGAS